VCLVPGSTPIGAVGIGRVWFYDECHHVPHCWFSVWYLRKVEIGLKHVGHLGGNSCDYNTGNTYIMRM
jgi:hypothetical protein